MDTQPLLEEKIKPFRDLVLMKVYEKEQISESGLRVAKVEGQKFTLFGTVLAIGPMVTRVTVGDEVVIDGTEEGTFAGMGKMLVSEIACIGRVTK